MKDTHMLLIYDCSVAHAESGSRLYNETEIIFICTPYKHRTHVLKHIWLMEFGACVYLDQHIALQKSCMICWNYRYALSIRNLEIEAMWQVGLHKVI